MSIQRPLDSFYIRNLWNCLQNSKRSLRITLITVIKVVAEELESHLQVENQSLNLNLTLIRVKTLITNLNNLEGVVNLNQEILMEMKKKVKVLNHQIGT